MPIADKMINMVEGMEMVKKMFEEGARLRAEHGPENVFDFSLGNPDVPPPPEFEKVLKAAPDEEYAKTWTMKFNGQEVFSAPKMGVVRDFVLNHIVHHRGQLTVFLRLNDVPLPMTIGPSADETGGF